MEKVEITKYQVRLIAVFAENKVGQLARVTGALAENQVNIRWVTIASSNGFGVAKFLVDDPAKALDALQKKLVPVTVVNVVAVEVQDKPGGLFAIAKCLAENNVNVNNASGFVAKNRAILLIEVNDFGSAVMSLQKNGFKVLTESEALQV